MEVVFDQLDNDSIFLLSYISKHNGEALKHTLFIWL